MNTVIDPFLSFVRVIERRPDGLVAFEFALGEPELYVEMLLPGEAFEAFCTQHAVSFLPERPPAATGDDWAWSLHDATRQRFR